MAALNVTGANRARRAEDETVRSALSDATVPHARRLRPRLNTSQYGAGDGFGAGQNCPPGEAGWPPLRMISVLSLWVFKEEPHHLTTCIGSIWGRERARRTPARPGVPRS